MTGAGGFIGSHFVRYLAARGWSVRAIDVHEAPAGVVGPRTSSIACRTFAMPRHSRRSLEGVEYVFNLASVHLDVHASFEEFEAVNVNALEQLVELCSVARVRRLVQVSSVGVYGHVTCSAGERGRAR